MALQNITQLFAPTFLTDASLAKTLGEEFILCENGSMVFHWADFFETCDLIKSQLESDPVLMEDFKRREKALKQLDGIPVWIRTEKKVHQSTMHEIYEKYILNRAQLVGGIDPFSPLEVSFISGTGPFKGMSVAECFNKSTYRDFILVYLLQGKLPKRDYRVRLKSKILAEYGSEFSQAELVSLEQLTMNGILISMDSQTYLKKFSSVESMRLLLNSKMLQEGPGMQLGELKEHLSHYAFNLLYSSNNEDSIEVKMSDVSVQSSFDFSKHKRVYLFAAYDKLIPADPLGVKTIQNFVTHTRELIRSHYQKGMSKAKSA
jgi:hypothetical protein